MAEPFDVRAWVERRAGSFLDRPTDEVGTIIETWRVAASSATGRDDVLLAGALQRHLTARGTGLPSNFALLLVPDGVVVTKFDARNSHHPVEVADVQFGDVVAEWPAGAVRCVGVDPGRLADGVELELPGGKRVGCRTPRLEGNPAAAAVLEALGAELPAG